MPVSGPPPSIFRIFSPSFLRRRLRAPEWMDAPDADADQLRRSLGYLRSINFLLGYTRSILRYLDRFSVRWKPGQTIWVLDIGTGSGDVPRALVNWSTRGGFDVRVIGLDLHAGTISEASGPSVDHRMSLVRANALKLPFENESVDYAICSLFLHHLDTEDAGRVLAEMNRVSRRGIIACDLLRNRRAYGWVKLLTLLANPMVRHDGPVSVAQAFTREEVLAIREDAKLGFARYFRHFGHRFALAGEKVQPPPA